MRISYDWLLVLVQGTKGYVEPVLVFPSPYPPSYLYPYHPTLHPSSLHELCNLLLLF